MDINQLQHVNNQLPAHFLFVDDVVNKSILFGKVNERDRLMFFSQLRGRVNNSRLAISKQSL